MNTGIILRTVLTALCPRAKVAVDNKMFHLRKDKDNCNFYLAKIKNNKYKNYIDYRLMTS